MPGEAHEDPQEAVEHFAPTAGRVTGVLGLVLSAGIILLGVVRPGEVIAPVMLGAALAGLLSWTALLRPRVSASTETLYFRNMLETIEIPLAAVDELAVRQVLAVRVGEKKYVSPGIGRKLRKLMKGPTPAPMFLPNLPASMPDTVGPAKPSAKAATSIDYADYVEGKLRDLIDGARTRHGVTRYSDRSLALAAQVRRVPAWPEIAALVVLVLALVVTIALL